MRQKDNTQNGRKCLQMRQLQNIQIAQAAQYKKKKKKRANDLNRKLSKEDTQIANKHKKRCSALHVIKEMNIKTTMRYHITPARMIFIKKLTNNKDEEGNSCTVVGM